MQLLLCPATGRTAWVKETLCGLAEIPAAGDPFAEPGQDNERVGEPGFKRHASVTRTGRSVVAVTFGTWRERTPPPRSTRDATA